MLGSAPALLALLLAAPTPGAPQIYERVVATVDTELITLSQLEFEARVELLRRGGKEAKTAPLDHATLVQNLSLAIGQRLAAREADRLGTFEVEQTALDAALNDFRQALAPLQLELFLRFNEVSPGEFQRILRRALQADKYLTARAQLRAPVTESEIDAFLAQHPGEVPPNPSKDVREALRRDLTLDRNRQLVQAELRRLYARAKVRIVDPGFAGADAPLRPAANGE
jgi:hypothetical protein